MNSRGSTLKLTAVLALVVLTMTGFSSGRHGHNRSSSGGGGCSSSSQNHGGSSTSSGSSSGSTSGGSSSGGYRADDDDSTYGSSGGSGYTRRPGYRSTPTSSSTDSGTTLKAGAAKLVSCATASTPYATVEIKNPNKRKAGFQAWVTFYDAEGTLLLRTQSDMVTVPAKGKAKTEVKLEKRFLASVDFCQVDQQVEPAN